MWQRLRKQLEKIQSSDEITRKRWLIGTAAVAMALVIGLWLVYINLTVNSVVNTPESQGPTTSFWSIFKTGLTILGNSIKESAKIFILKITGEKTITIE